MVNHNCNKSHALLYHNRFSLKISQVKMNELHQRIRSKGYICSHVGRYKTRGFWDIVFTNDWKFIGNHENIQTSIDCKVILLMSAFK